MTTDKKRGVQLPWGLSADNLTPGSMKTISAEKLKAFSVGNMNAVKQKSSVLKKKEEQEEKKKLEEEKQAQVYQDFVREFENDAPKTKTFISSGIINADKKESDGRAADKGRLYNPTGLKKLEEMNKHFTSSTLAPPATSNKKPEKPKKKQKEAEKKKSNLELFKDELKQQQAEREERHRLKKLGIIPMTAPDVIEGNFEPGMNMKDQIMGDFLKTGNNGGGTSNIYWDGSTYVDDPNSTNLYVGNISISVNEDKLCKMFGAFGPLASVKIMWPRNEEERRRDRNCGFVAFMVREHAEKALDNLNEKEIGGYPLRIGWGKSVPIPPHPVYVPPHMMAAGAAMIRPALTGLPFNAQPRKISVKAPIQLPPNQHDANELLRECIVYVLIPHDKSRLALINRMIEFVVVEGPMFEAMIMNREINNPAFAFLFDNKCPEHIYYRWKLFSLLQGENSIKWRTEEFRMFKNGSMWKPPPNAAEEEKKEEKKEEPAKKGQLSNSQRDKLEDMLRGLSIERSRVGECMHWCLQHADAAEEIVECVSESLSILQTPPIVKAARLFLCNDLLYNSCAEVPNASFYRTKLECKLAGIVINLKATYEEIKTHAAREKFKGQVMGCLRAWREWNVYSGEFLLQLDIIFIGGKDDEPSPDDVMDGMPLDVDGVPLAKEDDSDVDGAPMDVDGVPLVVPRLRKSKFDDDDIFTKAATPPPSLGSKWETSNWEKTEEKASAVKRSEPVYTPKEESDEKRKKKREIEVKVAEYVDKLESGKCTRINKITTTDQAEIYRYLLLKGRDAKKSIKQIATGKITLQSIQSEMKAQPCTSPILSERDRKHSKKRSKNNSMSALVASYGSSGPSRSPSPEPSKRKREEKKRRSNSPKHEKKKKSRH